ncbi:DUF1236 domain-containing protein [Rhodopseudomonas sp. HC1]|uniref:DUF1236 domain-containing protein n=1 Tax=Rhodopseudomonas infernalis TaxID=2897386 RepID=UPI001EE97F4D|nr:DUF1236 domain-containing protein [Rhodopseudomonas infernalis]MCG6203519.1 DUF1236 domain-containing protein [Rhodopseudomonas infernalis]
MINRLLISVATAALIAGGAAHAQGTGAGGSMGASPSAGSSAPAERGSSAPQMNRSGGGAGSGMTSGQDDRAAPGGATGQRAQDSAPKGSMSSDNGRAGGKDMKAEDRKGGEMDRKAGNDREQMNKNAADKDKDRGGRMNRNADSQRDRTTTGQAGAGAKLSTEQRTKITTVIKNQNIQPQTNVNFSISVGTRVPRDVRFHPLPAEIITVYPDWRGYEFFLVRDEIIVVNPRTLEIVAVLDA